MRFFVVLLLYVGSGVARAEKLSFAEGRNYFTAEKTATDFSFEDEIGPRNLEIKPCNREIVQKFWTDLSESIKDNKHQRKPAFSFYPEPASHLFLEKARDLSHAVFIRSYRECEK